MAHYMIESSYGAQDMAALVQSPTDRSTVAKALVEQLGGRIEVYYYAFGDYDLISIVELPDNISSGALALALAGSGAFKAVKTTVLLTVEDGMSAMRKAQGLRALYQPPSAA
jgi:uncharacterized protein with GYD domain